MPIMFILNKSAVKKIDIAATGTSVFRGLAFLYWAPCGNLKKTKKANGKSLDQYFWPSSDNKSGIVR
jgi:hypothetical protein